MEMCDREAMLNLLKVELRHEISSRSAYVEAEKNGELHLVLSRELLFPCAGDFRLSSDGQRLLDRLIPSFQLLNTGRRVMVVCHADRPDGSHGRQLFVDCWKLTGWCSCNVVRHFQWRHKMSSLIFQADGRSFSDTGASSFPLLDKQSQGRVEFHII